MAAILFSLILNYLFVVGIKSLPVRDIDANVQSDLVLVENPPAMQFNNRITTTDLNDDQFSIPRASGGALDLFYRYGFFSLSVRVVPRNDPGSWLVREPTISIFEPNSITQRQEMRSRTFEPYYQVYLCDDNNELLEAYFKDFKADGVEEPYKLYTGSWRTSTMAKYMGISPEALDGDSSFILVKLNKENRVIRTEGNPTLARDAQRSVDQIQIGNEESVLEFTHNYGSHYVKELTLGESIYQVFALTSEQYAVAKRMLSGVNRITANNFASIYDSVLAPWLIREAGSIKAASGDFQLQRFLDVEPKVEARMGSRYPNIFAFQTDPILLNKLTALSAESEAVIGLKFASLRFLVPSLTAREYYDEVVQTQIALWGSNIKK